MLSPASLSWASALSSCTLLCRGSSFCMLMSSAEDRCACFWAAFWLGLCRVQQGILEAYSSQCASLSMLLPAVPLAVTSWGHTRAPLPCRRLFTHTSKRLTTQQMMAAHFQGFFPPGLVSLCWQPQWRSAKGLLKILPLQRTDTGYLIPYTVGKPAFNSCLFSHLVHLVHHDLHIWAAPEEGLRTAYCSGVGSGPYIPMGCAQCQPICVSSWELLRAWAAGDEERPRTEDRESVMQTGASEKGDCGKHKFHRDHGKKTGSWCSREVTGGKGETRANREVWKQG